MHGALGTSVSPSKQRLLVARNARSILRTTTTINLPQRKQKTSSTSLLPNSMLPSTATLKWETLLPHHPQPSQLPKPSTRKQLPILSPRSQQAKPNPGNQPPNFESRNRLPESGPESGPESEPSDIGTQRSIGCNDPQRQTQRDFARI